MSRFVKPQIVRLPISQGDFLDVKKRLSAGEHGDLMMRLSPYQTPGEAPKLDTREVWMSKVLVYLVGWSFVDDDGKPVPYSLELSDADRMSMLKSLDPDSFREIREAIEAHEDAEDKVREAAKNGRGGAIGSSAISPSPVAVTGDTNGSETLTAMSTTF